MTAIMPLVRMSQHWLRTAVLFTVLLFTCSQQKASEDGVVVTVENGVTIITNPGLHLADTMAWSIDTTNIVTIGVLEGEQPYMFGRVSGVLLRPDGGVLVADAAAYELRVFDANGQFVRRVGRQGTGPGEFVWLGGLMQYAGDSVVVVDSEETRLNVLDPALTFVRAFRPRLLETRAQYPMTSDSPVGLFDDGSVLMSDFLNVCGERRSVGFCEDSVAFFRTDHEGATQARFGRHVYVRHQGVRVAPGHVTGWREPHPQAFWRVHGERLYYADSKRFEYRVYDSDGELERVVRVNEPPPQYTHGQVFREWPSEPNANERRVAARLPPATGRRDGTVVRLRSRRPVAVRRAIVAGAGWPRGPIHLSLAGHWHRSDRRGCT